MNKKLMAVAVAGALAAPAVALAQTSNVQIYGRANLGVDSWQATGATAGSSADFKSRTRVYDSGSRLGVRGTEDLGNGLQAMFVIESGANIDAGTTTNQNGLANGSAGTLASRDSYVGFGGRSWGDVRFGRQSVFWVQGPNDQSGPNYLNQEVGWTNGAGLGRVSGPSARQSNVMSYNSPTWGGLNFSLSYAPNSEAAQAGLQTNASVDGVTVRYEGPWTFQYDHGDNQAAGGGANRQKIMADKLSIGWPYMPGARIALLLNRTKNNDANAQANFAALHDNIKQDYWGLAWEHMIGNWQLMAVYSKLNKASGCSAINATPNVAAGTNGCDGTASQGISGGVKYFFSKRTQLYVSYIQHKNEFNQIADVTGAGYSSSQNTATGNVNPGADLKIYAIGLWHSF